MANTNTLNTRIKLKYDSYANWIKADPILLLGELAVAYIPADTGAVREEPAYLLKVGDGSKKFSELDWVSGKAADVYSWAKQASKPTYAATEITGLKDFISGQIQDTDTQYQIVANGDMGFKLQSKAKDGAEWADVNEITLTAPVYSLIEGDTNGTVKFGIQGSESEVAVHGLKSAAYQDTSAFDTAGAAAGVKTELIGAEGDLSSKDTIKGSKKYTDEKIDALDMGEVAVGTGEIIEKISETNGVVTASKRSLVEADIPALSTGKITGLDTALAGKQDNLVFNTEYNSESNKVATMTDVTTAVAGLSGAMHYIGESTSNPAEGTVTITAKPEYSAASGDVVTYNAKEFVYDGATWRELGDESSFAVKGSIKDADIALDANIAQSKIAGLTDALAGKATPADITSAIEGLDVANTSVATGQKITGIEQVDGKISVTTGAITANDIPEIPTSKVTNLDTTISGINNKVTALEQAVGEGGSVETQITEAIGNLDKADSAVTNQFVTQVSQENGIITVLRAQPEIANVNGLQAALDAKVNDASLAAIAKTGNVKDLVQDEGTFITIECGTASTVID